MFDSVLRFHVKSFSLKYLVVLLQKGFKNSISIRIFSRYKIQEA